MYMQYIFSNILIDIIVFWFHMCSMQIFDSIYYKCIALLMTSLKMPLQGLKHVGGDSQNK